MAGKSSERCDYDYMINNYPPAGGDGKGDNPCDDWPSVPIIPTTRCRCPPNPDDYKKWTTYLDLIPVVGQAINTFEPKNCKMALDATTGILEDKTAELVRLLQEQETDFESIVSDLSKLYSTDDNGQTQGIIADTLRASTARAKHITAQLTVIAFAAFLVLLGVVFTL